MNGWTIFYSFVYLIKITVGGECDLCINDAVFFIIREKLQLHSIVVCYFFVSVFGNFSVNVIELSSAMLRTSFERF